MRFSLLTAKFMDCLADLGSYRRLQSRVFVSFSIVVFSVLVLKRNKDSRMLCTVLNAFEVISSATAITLDSYIQMQHKARISIFEKLSLLTEPGTLDRT